MKILRRQVIEIDLNEIQVGDKIEVDLEGLGNFTATACKLTDKGTKFIFDECVAQRKMNNTRTNDGGYEASDLCQWINTELLNLFPIELKDRIKEITLPTYGQIFGYDEWYSKDIEPDEDEQFEYMTIKQNRKADFNNDIEWYWLKNATKKEYSSADFAFVYSDGYAYYYASASLGVRPVFIIGSINHNPQGAGITKGYKYE